LIRPSNSYHDQSSFITTDELTKADLVKLTYLDLNGTKIIDEGAAKFRKVLPKCKTLHIHKK